MVADKFTAVLTNHALVNQSKLFSQISNIIKLYFSFLVPIAKNYLPIAKNYKFYYT